MTPQEMDSSRVGHGIVVGLPRLTKGVRRQRVR